MNTSYLGGCMCGIVRFEARTEPKWVGICHCQSCRKATGGALVVAAGFTQSEVTLDEAKVSRYASSPGVTRFFCAACGTSIAYQSEAWPDDIHLFLGAFDEPTQLTPQFHIFVKDAWCGLQLADDLPKFVTTPSAGHLVEN